MSQTVYCVLWNDDYSGGWVLDCVFDTFAGAHRFADQEEEASGTQHKVVPREVYQAAPKPLDTDEDGNPIRKEYETMTDFGYALSELRNGKKVSRFGWNGPGQYLTLQVPDEHSKMTLPYIYITTVQGDKVPWLASQTDLLQSDWYVVI